MPVCSLDWLAGVIRYMLSEMICSGRRGFAFEVDKRPRSPAKFGAIITPLSCVGFLTMIVQFDKEGPVRPNPSLPSLCTFSSQRILLDEATVLPGNLGQISNSRIRR
uniref:Uncharacterized protein n=1 Tax=Fusarium oxysporum (strain Fo5176) TaxID=660025 RepID=A0A0D2YJM1_FUSOF